MAVLEKRKIKDAEFARMLDELPQTIYAWQKREAIPGAKIFKVARALGLNPEWVAEGVGPEDATVPSHDLLAQQIRLLRGEMTIEDAAALARVPARAWQAFEKGQVQWTDRDELLRIAVAFGFDLAKAPADLSEGEHGLYLTPDPGSPDGAARLLRNRALSRLRTLEPGPDVTVGRPTPIVGQAKLGEDGFFVEEDYPAGHGDGFIDHPTRDPNAYSLRVVGESMSPAIRHGWFVACEPNTSCKAGEYVHVMTKAGQHMVKELLYEKTEEITLLSVNGAKRHTFRKDEIEYMHYVGGIYPPSKRRL